MNVDKKSLSNNNELRKVNQSKTRDININHSPEVPEIKRTNTQYGLMEEELASVPVEVNKEDAKFEEMMRLESMNLKLGQFDSAFKKVSGKVVVLDEAPEHHEDSDRGKFLY